MDLCSQSNVSALNNNNTSHALTMLYWGHLGSKGCVLLLLYSSTQKRSWHPGGQRNIYLICEWWLNTKMCSNINTVNDCSSGVPFSFMVTLGTVWFMQEGQSREQRGNEGRKNYVFFLAPDGESHLHSLAWHTPPPLYSLVVLETIHWSRGMTEAS